MSGLLAGKVILISGAAGGIGSEICVRALDEGARVAAIDISQPALDRLGARIGSQQDDCFATAAGDVSDESVARALVSQVVATSGPIDVLINVAGTFVVRDYDELSASDWKLALGSNLGTTVNLCAAVVPDMVARGSGSVINFASTAGEYGSIRPAAHYAAAKGAIIAYSKSLAREVSPSGVRVNCISPGPVDTSMFSDAGSRPGDVTTGAGQAAGAARSLLGRMGRPAEIAAGAVYLASDESAYTTGSVLRINGGSLI